MKNLLILLFILICIKSDERVEIINLISSPEKYDQRNLEVEGYFRDDFEASYIYLNEESAKYKIYENGIMLIFDSISKRQFNIKNNNYIKVRGKFNKVKTNSRNNYGSYINKIYFSENLIK